MTDHLIEILYTIHDLQELNGFNAQILKDGRMTDEIMGAIARRRIELEMQRPVLQERISQPGKGKRNAPPYRLEHHDGR